jgi:hypothetical protein
MANSKTRSIIKKTIIVLVVILIGIQFIRPAKNFEANATPADINQLYPIPDSVMQILKKACYDCHSNNTTYPWYFGMQPVAWWMNHHITDAKKALNFSQFGNMPLAKQAKKLKKSVKEIQGGGMPLNSYLWIHKDAILTPDEKKLVVDWCNSLSAQITASMPDSAKAK